MDGKAWYKSKTLIGGGLALGAAIVNQTTGTEIVSQDDVNNIADKTATITEAVSFLLGIGMVVWGRLTAWKKPNLTK